MNGRGQFSIIAALFVAVVLIATVVITYSTIRNSQIQAQPQILSAIDETNFALKQVLGFTVGYYGSVLQVTGNASYAKELAVNYTLSGLEHINRMHPEWGSSFDLKTLDLSAYWYANNSWSRGKLSVSYNLTGLGLHGIAYETSSELTVNVNETTMDNQTKLKITMDEGKPLLSLTSKNFEFYAYNYANSKWEPVSPSDESIQKDENGTYYINMTELSGKVDPYSYVVKVKDPRGIVVIASSFSRYTCTLNWNDTFYSALRNAADSTIVVELLQNGTMRWLGQNFNLTTQAKPIPPIPVKAFHVNQTINDVSQEVSFQIEEWASNYKVPLSLASNASVFSNRNMLVFLVNPNVSKVTIWWNGSDTTTQTPLAYTNKYFTTSSTSTSRTIKNSILELSVDWSDGNLKAISRIASVTATAVLMRINNKVARWGYSAPAIPIQDGIVRAVLHHEVEWGPDSSYQILECPNVYAHIVLALPANATYYTYQLRLIFINSTQTRNITDICPIKITTSSGTFSALTENGTAGGYPIVHSSGLFYNLSNVWQHHWAQLNSSATTGFGIMFTDAANEMLYLFNAIAGKATGAVNVNATSRAIELLPVASALNAPVSFQYPLDICWYGAVVTFGGTTPLYDSANKSGLWIIVEYPPVITVSTES